MLGDLFKAVGAITGSILAIPIAVVAEALEITTDMVEEAKESGCETYDEIRDFWKL